MATASITILGVTAQVTLTSDMDDTLRSILQVSYPSATTDQELVDALLDGVIVNPTHDATREAGIAQLEAERTSTLAPLSNQLDAATDAANAVYDAGVKQLLQQFPADIVTNEQSTETAIGGA